MPSSREEGHLFLYTIAFPLRGLFGGLGLEYSGLRNAHTETHRVGVAGVLLLQSSHLVSVMGESRNTSCTGYLASAPGIQIVDKSEQDSMSAS
jgi:hypothetical protein